MQYKRLLLSLLLSPVFLSPISKAAPQKTAVKSDIILLNQTDKWMATQLHQESSACTSTPKSFCQTSLELAPNNVQHITSISIAKNRSSNTLEFSLDANNEHIVTFDLKRINGRIQCHHIYPSKRYTAKCVKTERAKDTVCIVKKGQKCDLGS